MVISLTKIIVEIGAFDTAEKKPAIPSMAMAWGDTIISGMRLLKNIPTAPPKHPPITTEGPKTPPDPPEPMLKEVVRILPNATPIKI